MFGYFLESSRYAPIKPMSQSDYRTQARTAPGPLHVSQSLTYLGDK
ncbi:uncharacterized protein METZ01_LOCUS182276 [marine metagenome]|uniref:Uncharacterized protein n=1 Tax=marine metagenome TaxID=408172 RepID=A0A382CUB2_9ZZZZ